MGLSDAGGAIGVDAVLGGFVVVFGSHLVYAGVMHRYNLHTNGTAKGVEGYHTLCHEAEVVEGWQVVFTCRTLCYARHDALVVVIPLTQFLIKRLSQLLKQEVVFAVVDKPCQTVEGVEGMGGAMQTELFYGCDNHLCKLKIEN